MDLSQGPVIFSNESSIPQHQVISSASSVYGMMDLGLLMVTNLCVVCVCSYCCSSVSLFYWDLLG